MFGFVTGIPARNAFMLTPVIFYDGMVAITMPFGRMR
jgi:hypothetical protein